MAFPLNVSSYLQTIRITFRSWSLGALSSAQIPYKSNEQTAPQQSGEVNKMILRIELFKKIQEELDLGG
jgi:hypothetical protein